MSKLDPFPKHPTDEDLAGLYHIALAGLALLGFWWHAVATYRHWHDRAE